MRQAQNRCITERHAGAFAVMAVGWINNQPEQRRLVRRCATCAYIEVSKLIAVDTRFMVCVHCLSQDVELDELSDPLSCVCGECGARSTIDVEEGRGDGSE